MRLRLYRIGSGASQESQHRPLLIDRLPFTVYDPAEWSPTVMGAQGLHECCEFRQVGDTLYVTDTSPDGSTQINGRQVSVAPALPGDRITLNTTEFLVSYERMTSAPPLPTDVLVQDTDRYSYQSDRASKLAWSGETVSGNPSATTEVVTDDALV